VVNAGAKERRFIFLNQMLHVCVQHKSPIFKFFENRSGYFALFPKTGLQYGFHAVIITA